MKSLIKLIVLAACIGSASGAFAKNKENCHKIGGKWLPGSTTNAEKGACIFLIAKGKNDGVGTRAMTTDACNKNGGKVSADGTQCTVHNYVGHVTLLR